MSRKAQQSESYEVGDRVELCMRVGT
ncbi:hypothetical protein PIIN_11214 [Serendipita indica DSM 11827]|uniref:Uncharacterized protein n=1 Tax=Serendipita indica (strain DSM 11827) TaxID=1109443 RepID=G4U0Y8_SERID|nr:hypothetical protein PIIN_11214 [Serendipita indica DSM 11827]